MGEISGLTSALMIERSRNTRLHRHKQALEDELTKVRDEQVGERDAEKAEFQKQVADALKGRDECQTQIASYQTSMKALEGRVSIAEGRQRSAKDNLETLKGVNLDLSGKLELSETARCAADEVISRLGSEVSALKKTLEDVPRREAILAEFRASEGFKQELIEARVSAVEAYKLSEDFTEDVKCAVECGVSEFKQSDEYSGEMDDVRKAAMADFRKGNAFKQAVGAEAGKMSVQVVECCREFFKADFERPTQEFGVFFAEFIRRRRSGTSGSSTMGSPGMSPSL